MSLKRLPNPEEVREAIAKFVPTGQAFDYFKKRGILIAAVNRDVLGEFGQLLFLDYSDYDELHDLATTGKVGHSISGFDISLKDDNEDDTGIDIVEVLSGWFDSRPRDRDQLYVEDLRQVNKDILQGRLVYTRRSPGKYELVGTVQSQVDFEVRRTSETTWHLLYFPQKITDQEQFKEIISEAVSSKYILEVPQLRGLPQEKRIEFYDRLLKYRFDSWTLNDVIGVKVKEPEQPRKDEIIDEAENDSALESVTTEFSEIEKRVLGSIQEAVLKGANLRTNPFVKQFEQDGYYFQSMTLRFDHVQEPISIDLEVNFKLRPIALEITIEKMHERYDNGEAKESSLPTSRQDKILETFWNTARKLLRDLRCEVGI